MGFHDKLRNIFHISGASVRTIKLSARWRRKTVPIPAPPSPPKVGPVERIINDPSTPGLVAFIEAPAAAAAPPFNVRGYVGGGYGWGSPEGRAANCHFTICRTLSYLSGRTSVPVLRWANGKTLGVIPEAGTDLNAFYDRRSLQFFSANVRNVGRVYTVNSSDVVAHELGHAILDAYRPDTWNAASLEVWSVHEAFGDFVAMAHLLTYPEALRLVELETGGDLRRSNTASRLAEEVGKSIRPGSLSLRDSVNSFRYVTPSSLPAEAGADLLAAEPHSFSRIMSGALYDLFVLFYDDQRAKGLGVVASLASARDTLVSYVLKAAQNAPLTARFYSSFAKTLLWADVVLGGRAYHDRMEACLRSRGLLPEASLTMLSAPKCPHGTNVIHKEGCMRVRLGDVLLRSQSNNPLYDAEVDVPNGEAILYDNEGMVYAAIGVGEEESLTCAQDMVEHLHGTGSVSDGPDTPFEVRGGRLLRSHF